MRRGDSALRPLIVCLLIVCLLIVPYGNQTPTTPQRVRQKPHLEADILKGCILSPLNTYSVVLKDGERPFLFQRNCSYVWKVNMHNEREVETWSQKEASLRVSLTQGKLKFIWVKTNWKEIDIQIFLSLLDFF